MIIDSSALIIFAKINKLDILIKLYKKLKITKEIYKETVEDGILINAPDARIIESFIQDKKIEIIELKEKYGEFFKKLLSIYSQLGKGEASVIALCLKENEKTLVMDESIARKIAKLYNLQPIGSLRILLEAYKNKIINEKELEKIIEDMINNKYRIGAEVINEFWILFEKLKKKTSLF